ncbi:MAG: cadmium-translocating P-type ATPase [Patescibacteria group bacterium]|nr:cadmium-translocating P-type ATPase [Patescibacteria group bacterium]
MHSNHHEHSHQAQHETQNVYNKHAGHSTKIFWQKFWVCLIFTIPILLLTPAIQSFLHLQFLHFSGDIYVLFLLSTFIYFYGGSPFLKGFIQEIRTKNIGMMTLIAVAISVAYFYSSATVFGLKGMPFFWELATLIDIMLLGHWLEMKSILGASQALEELAKLLPEIAHKIDETGKIIDVKTSELKINDHILVKPGEKIPSDGKVIEGSTTVNESMLTGESNPALKQIDSPVIGGSINGEGSITLQINHSQSNSFISQVINLVKEAQESKSKTQNLADRAAFWLTILAIIIAVLTFAIWSALLVSNFAFSLERAVTILVIACPHALGLAVPLVIARSTLLGAKNGLLVRNRTALEKARNIQAVIFDKTGTLTKGEFGITDIIAFDAKIDKDEILKYAASVEKYSQHPIAKAIASFSKETTSAKNFQSITGKGARAKVDNHDVLVVSPVYLRENRIEYQDKEITSLFSEGKTIVFVLVDNKLVGAIALADIIKEESIAAITRLKKMSIKSIMLTGDNPQVAKWVADKIGIDEFAAEVLPQNKANKVREIQSRGLVTAMVGDGINDAPALAQADVGIAIGAGTDVAVETSDIVLVKNNPLDAIAIIYLARATYKKMVQNLFWATGYNVVAIPLAAGILYQWGILLTPALGAVFMSISTIIVAINARLLKI